MEDDQTLADLNLIADDVCVDFVNTVERGVRYRHQDWIGSYQAFLLWARKAAIIDPDDYAALEQQSSANRGKAGRVFDRAIRLRTVLRRIFADITAGAPIGESAIHELNEFLAEARRAQRLEWVDDRAVWGWGSDPVSMDKPLWIIAMAAADLLTGEHLRQVRKCANPQCSWMFVDTSKNKARRWCEMDVCGNQAKARGHYARRKAPPRG